VARSLRGHEGLVWPDHGKRDALGQGDDERGEAGVRFLKRRLTCGALSLSNGGGFMLNRLNLRL
jgi:hypothetical protein